ncbi:hypothetical protein ACM39_11295 [Chryseobacterium sp. FH2]|nr:hypothetical protein ACM39_11295 [Chryseobacterium sp. FH2]
MLFHARLVMGQQVEGLKIEKKNTVSSIERRVDKVNDTIAKKNLNSVLKLKDNNINSTFGSANQYNSEVQNNVNSLQNNMNTTNSFNKVWQGQGIKLNKRK